MKLSTAEESAEEGSSKSKGSPLKSSSCSYGCMKACTSFDNYSESSSSSVLTSFQPLVSSSSSSLLTSFQPLVSSSSSSLGGEKKWKKMVNRDSRILHKEGGSTSMQKKYVRPGALSQLRDSRMNARALGRKRVLLTAHGLLTSPSNKYERTPKSMPMSSRDPTTPKTPTVDLSTEDEQVERESRLESLPLDLLVRILCHLHHDQLRAIFHVSRRIRKAVVIARRFHFNYTTPDRSQQDFLRGSGIKSMITPKAPKHGPRPLPRLSIAEMRQIAASLFQGSSSSVLNRKKAPSGLSRTSYRPLGSHRVLFYEEELCQAVAQNSIQ